MHFRLLDDKKGKGLNGVWSSGVLGFGFGVLGFGSGFWGEVNTYRVKKL
jgi:hypothetical protein